jgi:xanthine dehydrogenase accessory factor
MPFALANFMKNPIFEALAEAARVREAVTLAVITGVKGSSPQKIGAKAVFHLDGRIQGTLGGGCLEAEIQQRAMQSLRTGESSTFDLLLDHDFGWDDGLICGGKVTGVILPNAQRLGAGFWQALASPAAELLWGVRRDFTLQREELSSAAVSDRAEWIYQEKISPPCALWIAGAGHIAQAVAPLALQLDFDVTVFDDRPALANHEYFPELVSLRLGLWEQLGAVPFPEVPAFGLIVTRGHRHDALVLKDWIHRPFRFLGMIGSARKARTIFEHFAAEQIAPPSELERVACPVGLKIHARSVMEIAVSILAQYIEKRAELAAVR